MSVAIGQKTMSFHYLQTIPDAAFNDNLHHNPSGLSVEHLLSPFKNKNVQIGAAVSVSMYQNENHEGIVQLNDKSNAYVSTNEDDCFYTYQAVFRYNFLAPNNIIRPYVQGQFGGATFFSTLTMNEGYEDVMDNKTTNHGTTWIGGWGGGIAVKICESLYLDTNLLYNYAGSTNYRNSPDSNAAAQYRVDLRNYQQSSKVNHFAFRLGMNIVF